MKKYKHLLMPILTMLILLTSGKIAWTQTIVPNADFESYTTCPNNVSQMNRCTGWASATSATPDYFNNCASTLVSVPTNFCGRQFSSGGGHGYAGVYAFIPGSLDDYHEYIIATVPPTIPGTVYTVSVKVSVAETSTLGTDGFGILFNTHGGYTGLSTISRTPQVDFSSYGTITDTAAWTTLDGSFIADSAYTFVIIGVFKDSATVDTTRIRPVDAWGDESYYYIDEIDITPLETTEIPAYSSKFYPNPLRNDGATFSFNNPYRLPHQLVLFNVLGQQVNEWRNIITDNINIEKKCLSTGVYYYRLMTENNIVSSGKLLIE